MPAATDIADEATLGRLLRSATLELRGAGVDAAGNDARRLFAWALGLSAAQVLSQPERLLSSEEIERLRCAVARRGKREPVSRIIGARDFYGKNFAISPATLDPRPDSETLIETALDLARREGWHTKPIRILDVGTGSGCLLLTLLCELPKAVGVGSDISVAALKIARENALALGIGDRAQWLARDALEGTKDHFDILVSNPPYVRTDDIAALEPEVRRFDPWSALDGGEDGLRFFHRLAPAIRAAVPDGWAILEVGHTQARAVADLLLANAIGVAPGDLELRHDAMGVRRCVAGRTRIEHMPTKALGFFRQPG